MRMMCRHQLLILLSILLQVSPPGSSLVPDSVKHVYHKDKTVAFVEYGPGNQLVGCNIYDVEKHAERAELEIVNTEEPVMEIGLEQMLTLITACRKLDADRIIGEQREVSGNSVNENSVEDVTVDPANISLVSSFLRGIVPGTKWCGLGDEALAYSDVGSKPLIDSCCRAHDLCPVRLRPFRAGYGVINFSMYTKSHCDCDDEFLRCLKTMNQPLGDLIGNVYFNVMKFGCLESDTSSRDTESVRSFGPVASYPGGMKLRVNYDRNVHY